jgi:HlyD family secretion protein
VVDRVELEQLKIDRDSSKRARGRRSSRWTKPLVVLAVLGLLAFVFRARLLEAIDSLGLPTVKTERIAERNAAAVAAATGTSSNGYIVAKTRAALSADTPGRIVEMNVQEGSIVKKGDVVARLYADEYAASLRRTEADIEVARASKLRADAEVTSAEKALATQRSSIAAAESDVAEFEPSLKLAQLSLERANGLLENKVDTQDRVDRAQRDLDDIRSRMASTKARLETTKQAAAQVESQIAVSRAAVKQAEAGIAAAMTSRDLAQATLEKTAVRAPFDGIVVLKDAEVGEVVSPNSQGGGSARGSVVTMVDFATLEVQAEVPETSIANVKLGGEARIYLDAYPEKPYAGRVDRIWPTANRTKATVEVRVTFAERDDRLRPEMGVRVVFVEPAKSGAEAKADPKILVPITAIVRREDKTHVFLVEVDHVKLREIQTGPERAGKAAVIAGLAQGDVIVLEPPATLKDGDRVRVAGSTP